MQNLTRQEAERSFQPLDAISSRMETRVEGLRIESSFSNRKILILKYNGQKYAK
jgi:hypothetical protein